MATEQQAKIRIVREVVESIGQDILKLRDLRIKDPGIDGGIANLIRARSYLDEWLRKQQQPPAYYYNNYNAVS